MRLVERRLRALAGAVLAAAGLAAAVPPAAAQDKTQLVIGQLQFLTNFHPLIQVNNTKRMVSNFGLRPITAFDEKSENRCVLCAELPSIENGLAKIVDLPGGGKGMTVTLRLRDGLAWGDGTPVTSADILFTWQVATGGRVGFSNYNPWTRASAVEVVDARTAVLTLPRVLASYASWDQVLPAHLEGPIYAASQDADAYAKQSLYNTAPTTPGLWNGAFLLKDYQIGTRLVWERNPHWPGPQAGLARVVLSYRDNSAALMQNLLAGEIDAVPVSPGGISFAQMLDLRRARPRAFSYHIAEGSNLERIAVNLDNPILADVRVRRALLHGIDRAAIVNVLFDDLQPVAHTMLADSNPYFNPQAARYGHDQRAARALLAEAGWKPGVDGICTNTAGQRLSLELVSTAGNATREQLALVMQDQLKAICVEIVPRLVPLQEFNGEFARRRTFTGLMMSSIDFSPSTSPWIALASKAIPSEGNKWVGNNFSGYANPAMDAAIAELEAALSPEAARAAWAKVQAIFAEDLPMLPLYTYARAYVTVNDLKDFNQGTFDPLAIWSETWRRQ